jgi:hypothetical protein
MGKLEHLQFLVLMIPTFLVLGAAAVSMADLGLPESGRPGDAVGVVISRPLSGPLQGSEPRAEHGREYRPAD